MAIVLVLAGTFVYLRVADDLSSSIDDALRTRVDDLARQLQESGPGEVGLGGPHAEGAEDVLTQVLRIDGSVVASSEGIGRATVLAPPELAAARRGLVYFDASSVPGIENGARLLARPVDAEDGRFVILAGASTGDRAETLSGLVKTFAIGGPLALLLASALGWALAALALRPVEAMTERAQRITLARSGERLPLPAADDEIGRLGRTLNDMLARIESSIERERAFVADAGHELRTPIAILRSELELGLRPDRDHEEARAAMRSAIDEASRLEMLADDLLTLARSDAARLQIERRPVTVAGLLADTRARFAGRGEAVGRTIDVEAPPALVWNLDRDRIEAALGNLVENALRHGGGTITLSGRAAGEMLELSVADEGQGFPPGFDQRAFERFSRAEAGRTMPGTGLGLAIVKAIVEAHDGAAAAANVSPHGAVVALRLPSRTTVQTGSGPGVLGPKSHSGGRPERR